MSSEISYGKDGFGFSFGAGPAWGWSGVSTNAAGEKNGYQWFLWN
nr:polymorphic toxin type 25 domain-containing protein [Yersinia rohdei]